MKVFFAILGCLFSFQLSAAKLTIYLTKCRSECDLKVGKVKVFKDGKLIAKGKQLKTEVTNLQAGIYYVQYNTIPDKKRRLEVQVREGEDKVLTLCTDDFDYDKKRSSSLVDVLNNGEKIKIVCETKRGRNKSVDSLLVSKRGNDFYVNYHGKERLMTNIENEIIREFEYFLRFFSLRGCCRTKNKIRMISTSHTVKLTDRTCSWNGFHYLLVDFKFLPKDSCD